MITLQEFNSKYAYVTDLEQYGVIDLWEVIELKDGKYLGDCESYVLTLIDKVDGMQGLEPWYCEYTYADMSKTAHCIGIDKRTGEAIDCNVQKFVPFQQIKDTQGWQSYRKFTTFELWKGTTYAKIFKLLPRKVAIGLTNWLQ